MTQVTSKELPPSAIAVYFERIANGMSRPPHRACLMVNSVIEMAPHHAQALLQPGQPAGRG
jgi:hypothetical protein